MSADGGNAAEAAVAKYQTGIWMDHIGAIAGDSTHLGLQAQLDNAETQIQGSTPMVFEVVIYDLPGRDCAALASNGEIPATAAGLTQYETQYINPIASILAMPKYANLRIVAIIEPDSLPNVVTNQSKSACCDRDAVLRAGHHVRAERTARHPQRLQLPRHRALGVARLAEQHERDAQRVQHGGPGHHGQATPASTDSSATRPTTRPTQEPFLPNPTLNVGGNPLDSVTFYQFNPTFDELTYDTQMYNTLVSAGFPASKRFLIDTSRNGWGGPLRPTSLNSSPTTAAAYVAANKIDQRPFRGDWCNQNNAGIGAGRPTSRSGPAARSWRSCGSSRRASPTATTRASSHTHGDPHCDPAAPTPTATAAPTRPGRSPGSTFPPASGSPPSSRCWSRTPSRPFRERVNLPVSGAAPGPALTARSPAAIRPGAVPAVSLRRGPHPHASSPARIPVSRCVHPHAPCAGARIGPCPPRGLKRHLERPDGSGSITPMKIWGVTAVRVPLNEACWNAESYVNSAYAGTTYQQAVSST